MISMLELLARIWPVLAFVAFLIAWHVSTETKISNLRERLAQLDQELKDRSATSKENQILLQKIEIRMARLEEKISALSDKFDG